MNAFAFIVHPLDARDIKRHYLPAFFLPGRVAEAMVSRWQPVILSEVTVRSPHSQIRGWFIACPLTARLMLSLRQDYVLEKVIEAGRLAERLGARIVGLGAFTSVVGDAGIAVAKSLGIPVTTGNSYTVAVALRGAKEAARLMGADDSRARAAVVGATGSIGQACARLLAKEAGSLVLVARSRERLERLRAAILKETGKEAEVATDPARALPDADIVISVTSAAGSVIEPGHLKPGAVVCDVARPFDVSRRAAWARPDVLVIEGGVVRVPGSPDMGFEMGLPRGTAMACMAETMTLALEGRLESYTLGRRISPEKVAEIDRLAARHGFELAGLRSFGRVLGEADVLAVRERAEARRKSLASAGAWRQPWRVRLPG